MDKGTADITVRREAGQVVLEIRAEDGRAMTLRTSPDVAVSTAQHLLTAAAQH